MIVVANALIESAMKAMASHFSGSKLLVMAGERPAEPGAETTETQLATVELQPSVNGRAVQLDPIGEPLASVQGIATWGRIVAADDAWLLDADVGAELFNIRIDNTQFYPGSSVVLQQFSLVGA